MEHLRRVVSNLAFEPESLLDDLPNEEAILDFFDLWTLYDTDCWSGILECIADGEKEDAAVQFVKKWELPKYWMEAIDEAKEIYYETRNSL